MAVVFTLSKSMYQLGLVFPSFSNILPKRLKLKKWFKLSASFPSQEGAKESGV